MSRLRQVERQWRYLQVLSKATSLTAAATSSRTNHCRQASSSSWISPWPRQDRFADPWRPPSSPTSISKTSQTKRQKQVDAEKRMKRHEIKSALSQIWHHSQQKKSSRPSKALRLLEQLLVEEASTGKRIILKPGIVFNVLKVVQQQDPRANKNSNEDTREMIRLEHVLQLLEQNERLWDAQKWPSLVLGALAKRDAVRAERLLHEMHELYLAGEAGAQPGLLDYGALLQAYARQGMSRQAEQLLKIMEERCAKGEMKEGPNTISYSCVVDALAKSHSQKDERNAADRAARLVTRMEGLSASGNNRVRPNIITYSSLLKCYANEGNADEAEELLQRMHGLHESGSLREGPNIISYSNAMKACARSEAKDAPIRCYALLKRIHELHDAGYPDMRPGTITYSILLNCFAKHGMARESIQVLKEMHDLHSAGVIKEEPNTVLYNHVISAVAQSDEEDAPERAEALLNLMREMNASGSHIQPNMFSFCSLLNCYAEHGMADEAETLLHQIQDRYEAGLLKEGPNTILYNTVMNIHAKSQDKNASQRVGQLLEDMVKFKAAGKKHAAPDLITYTTLLNCYASEGKADEAELLLQEMDALYKAGELEKPNIVSYGCVMDAFCKSGEVQVSRRAEALIARMWNEYSVGLLERPPDPIAYASLLKCYANEGMAREAEDLLRQMHDLHEAGDLNQGPNTILYNIAIDALASSGDKDAPDRAKALLQKMEEMHHGDRPELKPDVVTYTSILKCYAAEGMASNAEQLLSQMQEMYQEGQLKDGPNIVSYNIVMSALAKSREKDVTERAQALLKQMCRSSDLQPDEFTKSSFVHCHTKAGDSALGNRLFDTATSS